MVVASGWEGKRDPAGILWAWLQGTHKQTRLLTVEGQESHFQGESRRRNHGQKRKELGELGVLTSVLSNCRSRFHSYPDKFILNMTPLINKS